MFFQGEGTKINSEKITEFEECSASSIKSSHYNCDMIMDDDLTTSWVSLSDDPGEWVKLEFIGLYEVHAIDLWSGKSATLQCSELMFSFSNGVTVTVSCFLN